MREVWRARLLGATLFIPIGPVLLFLDQPLAGMLSFALAITGLFLIVVVSQSTVPARDLDVAVRGDAAERATLRRALDLSGPPVYVPASRGAFVFLAKGKDKRPVPGVEGGTADSARREGVALPSVGWAMFRAHAQAARTPLALGLNETERALRAWLEAGDLARGLSLQVTDRGFSARFKPGVVAPPCLEDAKAPACVATGCQLCQAIGCALATATAKPLEVVSALVGPGSIVIGLEAVP